MQQCSVDVLVDKCLIVLLFSISRKASGDGIRIVVVLTQNSELGGAQDFGNGP